MCARRTATGVLLSALMFGAGIFVLTPTQPVGEVTARAAAADAVGDSSNPAVNDRDEFAWKLFVALNAPADNGTNDAIWETWANQTDVYADPNKEPTWPAGARAEKRLSGIVQQQLRDTLKQLGRPNQILLQGHGPSLTIQRGGGEEVRMNRATFDFIVRNKLWYREGQEAVFTSGGTIDFPTDAKEIKAVWKPITEADKPRYHWNKDDTGKLFGLIALHISSKDLPNWFWATFEHVDNPARCKELGCHDSFGVDGAGKPSKALLSLFKAAKMGSEWENYRLDGTQVDFTDSTGRPTLLGNSIIENGFVATSSCITCHARSTINGSGEILPIFAPDGQSYNGTPDPNWFYNTGSNPPTRKYLQRDFVYSLLLAKPRGN